MQKIPGKITTLVKTNERKPAPAQLNNEEHLFPDLPPRWGSPLFSRRERGLRQQQQHGGTDGPRQGLVATLTAGGTVLETWGRPG
jgi:hypothetical protein